jgi:HPt (histidine-containing phosphotransfer) domain-containing protein
VPIVEGTSGVPAQRAGSRLPAAALAGLREAFAEEVNERLPRLRAAVATRDAESLRAALRDVHTLGSSAYVVGEDDAAVLARAAEAVLLEDGDPAEFSRLVADLHARLESWLR